MRFLMLNWRDHENPLAGGAERVTLEYWNALAERGHEAVWWSFHFPGAAREGRIKNVQIVRGGGTGTSILAARRWVRKQPKFDLIVDQHHGIPWLAPWWGGTNCVAFIHEVLGPIWNSFYPWPISRIGQIQERWFLRRYRRTPFWTACPGTRDDLKEIGVHDISLIPYGVWTEALESLPSKPLTTPLRLIVVSRLAPNKRIHHAIQAVAALLKLGVPANLTIVGSGETEPELRRWIDQLGLHHHVAFSGQINENEKDQLLKEAHFLLHTSQREGWGLNVIEANAMGTPGAVYPVRGLVDSTLKNETGLVSEQETPESLADEIERLLKNPERYEKFRVQAWRRAQSFHWNNILPQAVEWLETQAGLKNK